MPDGGILLDCWWISRLCSLIFNEYWTDSRVTFIDFGTSVNMYQTLPRAIGVTRRGAVTSSCMHWTLLNRQNGYQLCTNNMPCIKIHRCKDPTFVISLLAPFGSLLVHFWCPLAPFWLLCVHFCSHWRLIFLLLVSPGVISNIFDYFR